jgi:hypothetical protein
MESRQSSTRLLTGDFCLSISHAWQKISFSSIMLSSSSKKA